MNTLNRTARLVSATVAVALTAALFASVVSFAEPQRSTLIAKQASERTLAAASWTVRLAVAR